RRSLRVRLVEHDPGLAPRLVLQLVGRLLGGDERRAQQRLEVAVAGQLALELLDAVCELGALPPDLLERARDVLEQLVDRLAPVAAPAAREVDVVELHRGDGHDVLLRSSGQRARRSRASARSARAWPPRVRGRVRRAAAGSAGRSAGTARTRRGGTPGSPPPTTRTGG